MSATRIKAANTKGEIAFAQAIAAYDYATRLRWVYTHFGIIISFARETCRAAVPHVDINGYCEAADLTRYSELLEDLAAEIEAIVNHIVQLPHEQRYALEQSAQGPNRIHLVRKVIADTPAGVAFLARKDAKDAQITAAQMAVIDHQHMAHEAAQPAAVLAAVEAAGAVLSLDKAGKNIMATGRDIHPDQCAGITRYKAGIVALLAERAAVAAPRLVA